MTTPLNLLALCAAAVAIAGSAAGQCVIDPRLEVELIVDGFSAETGNFTTAITFIDDDTMLAVNRADGRVVRVDLVPRGVAAPGAVVLDLDVIAPGPTDSQSEYGVQALKADPDFETNGFIYVRYDQSPTAGVDTPQSAVAPKPNFSASDSTQNVIERYVWTPDAQGGEGALIFDALVHTVTHDTRYHHGGGIAVLSDGTLAFGNGDLRRYNTDGWWAATAGPLYSINLEAGVIDDLGVIVRVHGDGSVPADNPFDPGAVGMPPGVARWFAYGVRNSFAITVDPATGSIWNTDNGENLFDEVNRVEPGSNLGWRKIMGPEDHHLQQGSTRNLVELPGATYHDPLYAWLRPIGVTGISFLHGSALGSSYDHLVLVGGINIGYLWALPLNAARDDFAFVAEGLQDHVDDRANPLVHPIGTEVEELFFGEEFGGPGRGIIAIERSRDGWPCVLTATGKVYRIHRALRPTDVNGDGVVNVGDLLAQLGAWGPCIDCPPACMGDIDGDCAVGINDLLALLADWG